ncbi:DUF423 domain-containing protein [Arenibacter sp. GZD96]|uniref:DUF423 domain-containing protein n=1 Tax=Aurantibrevibacter litoralis TaxID=3106030 RepID=UPI002AFE5EA8|nr:DUF423 domain-containing protein [Arenibacter sp. GZD-96]MEA1786406.1 DUF423 domain-containing protein [Arenibacter sp. GZD-96]
MILLTPFIGALLGFLAILFGAFGAHRLKKRFTSEQLQSFETGVKYQMYHAILLIVIGFNFGFNSQLENVIVFCFIVGTFLFSFSIYGLCLSASKGKKLPFLGPITPLGGLFLAVGWALLAYYFVAEFV